MKKRAVLLLLQDLVVAVGLIHLLQEVKLRHLKKKVLVHHLSNQKKIKKRQKQLHKLDLGETLPLMLIQTLSIQNRSKKPSKKWFNNQELILNLILKRKRLGRIEENKRKSLKEKRESLTDSLKSTASRRRYKKDSLISKLSIPQLNIRVSEKFSEVTLYKMPAKILGLSLSKTKTCKTLF